MGKGPGRFPIESLVDAIIIEANIMVAMVEGQDIIRGTKRGEVGVGCGRIMCNPWNFVCEEPYVFARSNAGHGDEH